jgi:hypothetical protein
VRCHVCDMSQIRILICADNDGRADNNAQVSPEEKLAMERFYGGKRCVVTLWDDALWAHMLDAPSSSSNPQVRLSNTLLLIML